MIGIIDYDAGNLKSVEKALHYLGKEVIVTRDPKQLRQVDKVILPGVGAFGDAMAKLKEYHLDTLIHEIADSGKPFLGICLGLQLLFEESEESPGVEGLGILKGKIKRIPDEDGLKVPHIGWNRLDVRRDDPLFRHFENGRYVYYVHSFYAKHCEADTLATSDYSMPVTGVVRRGSVYGVQFHPEKSGDAGLGLLRAFAEMQGEEP